jgi:hypothetical protein
MFPCEGGLHKRDDTPTCYTEPGPMTRAPLALLGLSLLACGEHEPVPFGLGRTEAPAPPETPETAVPLPRMEIAEWGDHLTVVDIDGARWDAGASEIRATLARDLDGDGDLDALALTATPAGAPTTIQLALGTRDGAAFAGRPIGDPIPLTEGCTPHELNFEPLESALVAGEIELSCPNRNGGPRELVRVVIELVALPRVLERFRWRGSEGEGLALTAIDRDEDGHADLVVEAFVGTARASLVYRSTAAGLSREGDAPEPEVAALADEARAEVRRHPDQALATAERALSLWEALCRESERPRFAAGGTEGIACGSSVGAARARAVVVAAHARLGHIVPALSLEQTLAPLDAHLRDAERRLVSEALASLPAEAPAIRTSVDASPLPGAVRRSTLAFLDEAHVLVLSGEPRHVGLDDATTVPASTIDGNVVDPAGQLQLFAIERRCEGTVVVVGPRGAPPLEPRTPLVEPRPAPIGVPCPALTAALRADASGFVALGWAPQGILLARLDELWVVPLDVTGASAGPAAALAEGAPAPAPVLAGAALPDVSAYALATAHGILLVERGAAPSAVLVRPEGFAHEGTAVDVAVSPSHRRLAWLSGGHLVWIER